MDTSNTAAFAAIIALVAGLVGLIAGTRALALGHGKVVLSVLGIATATCFGVSAWAYHLATSSTPSAHDRLNQWLHHNRAVISSQSAYVNPDGSWTVLFTTPGTCKGTLTADVDPTTGRVTITGGSTNEPDCLDEVGFDTADTDLGQFV